MSVRERSVGFAEAARAFAADLAPRGEPPTLSAAVLGELARGSPASVRRRCSGPRSLAAWPCRSIAGSRWTT